MGCEAACMRNKASRRAWLFPNHLTAAAGVQTICGKGGSPALSPAFPFHHRQIRRRNGCGCCPAFRFRVSPARIVLFLFEFQVQFLLLFQREIGYNEIRKREKVSLCQI